jgi:hypothetical protein
MQVIFAARTRQQLRFRSTRRLTRRPVEHARTKPTIKAFVVTKPSVITFIFVAASKEESDAEMTLVARPNRV